MNYRLAFLLPLLFFLIYGTNFISAACSVTVTQLGNSIVDVPQYLSAEVGTSGCTGGSTQSVYWELSNYNTEALLGTKSQANPANPQPFAIASTSSMASAGSVTDNGLTYVITSLQGKSGYTNFYTVYSQLTAGSPTPTSPGIDNGQTVTLTNARGGGSGSYSWQWYTGAGCTSQIGGATSSTYGAAPSSTTNYYYQVTDTGTDTPDIVCSSSATVTVYTAISAGAITPASPTIDNGQSITLSSAESGGVPSFTYQWYTGAACTSAIGGATSSTYAASPSSTTTYYYKVTDSSNGNSGAQSACSAGDTVTVNTAMSTPTIAVSNTIVDTGQYETLSAYTTHGTGSYTYNFLVYNSVTNVLISNDLVSSNTYNFQIPSSWTANNLFYSNVFVTDSAHSPATVNSLLSSKVTVNTPLGIPTITISNTIVDASQSYETLSAYITGGTTSYTYNFLVYNSVTNVLISNDLVSSNTYNFQIPSSWTANNLFYANVFVTDSATKSETTNSILTSKVTVNTALTTPTLTVSNVLIDYGQYSLATPVINGGSANYVQNIIISNAVTNIPINSITVTVTSGTSELFYFPSWYGTSNTLQINVIITDSATANVIANSIYTALGFNAIVVAGAPTASNSQIDNGQYSRITSNPSLGTQPYTYQWYTGAACTSAIGGATSSTYLAQPASTTTYYYKVIDSATTPTNACSSGVTVTVNPAVSVTIGNPSNTIVDVGQYQSFTATITPGTSTYTYTFNAFNSIVVSTVTNGLFVSPTSSLTDTWTYFISSLDTSNSPEEANVLVYDSSLAGATSANSVPSSAYSINAALSSVTISLTNTLIDYGQYSLITTTITGGSPNYQANFIISNSVTGKTVNSIIVTSSTPTSLIYFPSWYAGNTLQANVVITDSATANEILASAYSPLGFNAIPIAGAITPSAPMIDNGQSVTLTSHGSSGTAPLSINWFSGVSGGCTGGVLATGVTYTPSPSTTTTYTYNVVDSATTPVSTCSASDIVTVNPSPGLVTLVPSNTYLDNGQYVTYTASWGATTPTYTVTFYNVTGAKNQNQQLLVASTTATNTFKVESITNGNAFQYNAVVTDSALVGETYNSITNTIIVNTGLGTPSISPSASSTYDVGTTITFASYISSGTAPYTYNFLVYNSVTNKLITNSLQTTNTFAWVIPSWALGNTVYANVIVTDSASTPETTNSILSGVQSFNQVLSYPTLSFTNTLIDYGQFSLITPSYSGGTPNYVENIIISNSVTNVAINSIMITGSGAIGVLVYFPSWYAGNTLQANIVLTDSAFAPLTTNSIDYPLGFNALPVAGAITPASPTIDLGQSIVLTSNPSLGTSPYTIYWYGNNACSGAPAHTGTSFSVTPSTGSWIYAYNVVDSATTNAFACSSGDTVTVNPTFTASISASITPVVLTSEVELFTATVSGGTPLYTTFNFLVYNSITNTLVANMLTSSSTFSWTVPSADAGNTIYANVIVTDSAYNHNTANSILTSVITINPYTGMSTPTLTPFNNQGGFIGEKIPFNAYVTGGAPAYTYNFLVYNSIDNKLIQSTVTTSNSFIFTVPSQDLGWVLVANVFVTDQLDNTVNSVPSGLIYISYLPPVNTSSFLFIPAPKISGNTLDLGSILTILCLIFIGIRLAYYRQNSIQLLILTFMSGIFLTGAVYFFLNPFTTTLSSTSIITGGVQANIIQNSTQTTAPAWLSEQPFVLYFILVCYYLFMFTWLFFDIRELFFTPDKNADNIFADDD